MKSDSRAVPGVGSAPQTEVIMGEQQERKAAPGEAEEPKSGWLARWRERRRSKSARGADIGRRLWEADRRNVDKAEKYGHGQ